VPTTPTYPGVYIEEVPSGVRTITGVSTSVAAFVGYTQRGPTNEAVQIFSYSDYERQFGGFHKDSPVSYAAHHFFLNGGTEAWVVRVTDSTAQAASVTLANDVAGTHDVLLVTSRSIGALGNNLRLEVDYDTANPNSLFNLTVTELVDQGGTRVPGRIETHRNLSMNSFSPGWVVGVVNAASNLIQVARPLGVEAFATAATATSGVLDGSALGLDDDHRHLALSVHGAPPLEFAIFDAGGTAPANVSDLADVVQGKLETVLGAGVVAVTSITGDTQLNFEATASPDAERSELRFVNASQHNATGVLKLGVANGGTETSGAAAIRPAENGTRASGLPDLTALPDTVTIDVTVVAPPAPDTTVDDIAVWTLANKPATLEDVRQRLQSALAASANPTLSQARVTLDALGLRVVPGGPNPNAHFEFADADDLLLTTGSAGVSENLALYAPGLEGVSTQAQTAGAGGNDGGLPQPIDLQGLRSQKTGLFALENVDIFNILCLPDQSDPGLLSTAIAYAAERRAFVVLDFPIGVDSMADAKAYMASNGTLRNKNAAIYFPRIHMPDPLDNGRPRAFPAAGAVAGIYARTDATRGVWKAPAGTEARLGGVQKVDVPLTDPENGALNPLGINCIRTFPVYGPVIWGSRTLEGADALASEWKYVPVRRFALFLEESLFRGTKWVVFEPNDEPLWAQIRLNLGAFMQNLFRQGAFQGQTPREAYFVKCDKETTTQTDVNLGIVNILVGFAPLKPAEFVIIKIQQMAGQIPT
jgi:phage tail sheath protein FI